MTIDRDAWWQLAASSPEATFFHSPLWHELVTAGLSGVEDATMMRTLTDGTSVVIPLLRIARRGPLVTLASSALGCYGGPIAARALDASQRREAEQLLDRLATARVLMRTNPYATAASGRSPTSQDVTHVLDLSIGYEDVAKKYKPGRRQAVRSGIEAGVRIRTAITLEDYRTYFDVYQDSIKRWGDAATSNHPWRLFEAGHRLAAAHPDHIRLWLAELDDQIVSGAWCFYWNRHVTYWHGAALTAFRSVGATDALIDHVIRDACDRGCAVFDFNPSGGHEGVAAFKRHFGAAERPADLVIHDGRVYSAFGHFARWRR